MKFVKVNFIVEELPGGHQRYIYPEGYDPSKINVIYPADGPAAGQLIGVATNDFPVDKTDIIKISKKEAQSIGETYRPGGVRTIDQGAVEEALKIPERLRTAKQRNCLDPGHVEPGVNMIEKFDINKICQPQNS